MIVLISGPIAVGKTSAAEELADLCGGRVLKVRSALAEVLGIEPHDRRELQLRGAALDRATAGRWLRDYVEERLSPGGVVIVDSMRTRLQTVPVLTSIVDSRLVYLHAHEATRRARYQLGSATDVLKASTSFSAAMNHPTEKEVESLRPLSHVVVETDDLTSPEVAKEIVSAVAPSR